MVFPLSWLASIQYYDASMQLFKVIHIESYPSIIQKLFICSRLAEALDMQPPVMPEDGHTTRVTTGEEASSPASGKDSSVLEAVWDDEDTRAFYECLPDLRLFF